MTATYTLSDAAAAAGVPVATVRSWFGRGWLPTTSADRPADVAGGTMAVTINTVLAVAVMAALSRAGVPVERAMLTAHAVAHTRLGNPRRLARGALYNANDVGGATVVVVRNSGSPRILRIDADTPATELLTLAGGAAATLLVVDGVARQVEAALSHRLHRVHDDSDVADNQT